LRFFHGVVEGEAIFHFAEDYVGRRIENSVEAFQVNRGHLIEERKNRHAVHDRGFEEEFLFARQGQVAEFAVGVDDGAFVGGDSVGSVFERRADVLDGGLAGFDVERCGFEEDVGAGGGEPGFRLIVGGCGPQGLKPAFCRGVIGTTEVAPFPFVLRIESDGSVQAVCVSDPAQAAGGDSGDAVRNAVAVAKFLGAVFEEADQRPVDVAEAEEAQVVSTDGDPRSGAKARFFFLALDAALKRRSSTVRLAEVLLSRGGGRDAPRRPAGRRRYENAYPITVVCSGLIL
jgi:hypothetical protein